MKINLLIMLCLSGMCLVSGAEIKTFYDEMLYKYGESSHLLDKVWQDSGQALDVLIWDMEHSSNADQELLHEGRELREKLRNRYLAMEEDRKAIRSVFNLEKPKNQYLIAVENLEEVPATYYNWAGFRQFRFRWADGTVIEVPLTTFSHAVYNPNYYNGGDGGPGVFIYGRQSASWIAVSDFELPAVLPEGDCTLEIVGMDCDKGGAPTRIAVTVYGNQLFSGENPFPKDHSGPMEISVPATALQRPESTESNMMVDELQQYQEDIALFEKDCRQACEDFARRVAAAPAATPLYPQVDVDKLLNGEVFVRALDFTDILFGADKFPYPGYNYNYKYLGRLPAALHANLVSFCVGRPGGLTEELQVLQEFDQEAVVPYLVWCDGEIFLGEDIVSTQYFGKPERLNSDLAKFKDLTAPLKKTIGIQVDEPTIREKGEVPLIENEELMAAWKAASGSDSLPPVDPPEDADGRRAYMEYQYFKADYMAEHYKRLFEQELAAGNFVSLVVMDMHTGELMAGSYVSMGRALPYLGTDLYDNGSIRESVSLQLLKNAACGRVIMWPGAGYSCKSPRTFRRSLLNGMAWGDGIQMWTLQYYDRYRDANSFWRTGGESLCVDDKGCDLLGNYDPEYAGIVSDVFADIEKEEPRLLKRTSANPAAVLLSERTLFANVRPRQANSRLFLDYVGLYSQLAGSGRPMDALYVENLPERIGQYDVLVIADAMLLAPEEVAALTTFVQNGGTLIVCGETGSRDMYDWPLDTWSLSEITGVINGKDFADSVKRETISVVEVISNRSGKGVTYWIAASRAGMVVDAQKATGLAGTIRPELAECLETLLERVDSKVKVSAPQGVVTALQRTADGKLQLFAVDFRNDSDSAEVTVTIDGKSRTYPFSDEYAIISLEDFSAEE